MKPSMSSLFVAVAILMSVTLPLQAQQGGNLWYAEGLKAYSSGNMAGAAGLFRLAAEGGERDAMHRLGHMLEQGQGVAVDSAEAMRLFQRAAELGERESQQHVGSRYIRGAGLPRDIARGVALLIRSADAGYSRAVNDLTAIFESPALFDGPNAALTAWAHRAAEAGNTRLQQSLGRAYMLGRGVDEDFAASARWYRKAGREAEAELAGELQTLRDDAARGDAAAGFALGFAYYAGQDVRRDQVEAYRLFRGGASAGHVESQVVAAIMLGLGEGGAGPDQAAAARELRAAADVLIRQENWRLLLHVAQVFLGGEAVAQDRDRAREYVHAAARGGDSAGEGILALFDAGVEAPQILSAWHQF